MIFDAFATTLKQYFAHFFDVATSDRSRKLLLRHDLSAFGISHQCTLVGLLTELSS